jgi:hypothetical protein
MMINYYGLELLAKQRVADLQRVDASRVSFSTTAIAAHPRSMRETLGRGLVRVGERLVSPAGVAATR